MKLTFAGWILLIIAPLTYVVTLTFLIVKNYFDSFKSNSFLAVGVTVIVISLILAVTAFVEWLKTQKQKNGL